MLSEGFKGWRAHLSDNVPSGSYSSLQGALKCVSRLVLKGLQGPELVLGLKTGTPMSLSKIKNYYQSPKQLSLKLTIQ